MKEAYPTVLRRTACIAERPRFFSYVLYSPTSSNTHFTVVSSTRFFCHGGCGRYTVTDYCIGTEIDICCGWLCEGNLLNYAVMPCIHCITAPELVWNDQCGHDEPPPSPSVFGAANRLQTARAPRAGDPRAVGLQSRVDRGVRTRGLLATRAVSAHSTHGAGAHLAPAPYRPRSGRTGTYGTGIGPIPSSTEHPRCPEAQAPSTCGASRSTQGSANLCVDLPILCL